MIVWSHLRVTLMTLEGFSTSKNLFSAAPLMPYFLRKQYNEGQKCEFDLISL